MIVFTLIRSFVHGFLHGPGARKPLMRQEKRLRSEMDHDRIDSMIDDSFPASDPPSTY